MYLLGCFFQIIEIFYTIFFIFYLTFQLNITIIIVMSSTIRMKKKDGIYIYESTSYWNKEKKAPRTKMRYLGKEDPETKKIISPGKKWIPKSSKDYGNFYFLNEISNNIGVTEILKETFPSDWEKILTCAFFEISEGKSLYLCNAWIGNTYNNLIEKLPSQRISELLKRIGEDTYARLEFSNLWIRKLDYNKYVVFDITSISSYSKSIEFIEWGYNRDKEKLPQINVGMLFGQPSLLPIFYNVYPGSIKDVSTLENILKFSKQFKLKNVTFILDKGFYSSENLKEMRKRRLNFIIPLPFTVDEAKKLIEKHEKEISDVSNSFRLNKQILYCIKDKITVENISLNTYIYFDKRKKLEAEEKLLERIMEAEDKVKEKHFIQKEKLESYLSQDLKKVKKYFKIKRVGKVFALKRKREEIIKTIKKMGYMILLSVRNMKREEIIFLYRNKDGVEKCFDKIKNELDSNRLKVHSQEAMEGRLFIIFITIILYSWISKVMREKKLNKKYTIDEVMYELKKIKIFELENGKKIITEISKKQKDLFKKIIGHLPKT